MGLLGNLFGGEKAHPQLEPSSDAARKLTKDREMLEGFAKRVQDKLEVVPAERGFFVFVGKPPGTFGIVWFHDGKEMNFKTAMKDHGLTAAKAQILSDDLRAAYTQHKEAPRYSWPLAGRTVTVTPDAGLAGDVQKIISQVES